MELTERFLGGLPWNWLTLLFLFALQTLTLLFSMIVASRLVGGIDFGAASTVTVKSAGLLAVIAILNFIPLGILLAGPVWFLGLMFLFSLDYKQTRKLSKVNWGMNALCKLLLVLAML
jgi:hypothetical protein